MRRRCKSFGLAAVLVLLFLFSTTAFAEDRQGASGWQVSFDGKQMESNFTSGGMSDEVGAMQPGDSVEFTIALKNNFSGQADWYMKNEVLESLEDAGNAAGGAYDYLLTYTDTAGETSTLYASEKFGGEGRIGGMGLHGATTTLEDYFYLDRMGSSASGTVKLKVALDGETLVNDYQDTLARLKMDFAVELVSSGTEDTGAPGENTGTPTGKIIRTGDEMDAVRSLILMFGSGVVLLAGAFLMFGRKKQEVVLQEVETTEGEKDEEI